MLFIPFIENAVKHATNKKVNNAVDIHIKIETNGIWFECKNSFNPLDNRPKKDGGLGNELIQKRLNLLYPERHSLKVVKNENQYHVSLRIDHG